MSPISEFLEPGFNETKPMHNLFLPDNSRMTASLSLLLSERFDPEDQNPHTNNLTLIRISDLVRSRLMEMGILSLFSISGPAVQNEKSIFHPSNFPSQKQAPAESELSSVPTLIWEERNLSTLTHHLNLESGLDRQTLQIHARQYFQDLSQVLAAIDLEYDAFSDPCTRSQAFYEEMTHLRFLPGRALLKANLKSGQPYLGNLSSQTRPETYSPSDLFLDPSLEQIDPAHIPTAYLNLAAFIEEEEISWAKLRCSIQRAIHFLDNAIDFYCYPTLASKRTHQHYRAISLGVMGWADLLYILRIPYDSEEAVSLADRIGFFIQEECEDASRKLAQDRGGVPYRPEFLLKDKKHHIRHLFKTSLQVDPLPCRMAQVSEGIFPYAGLISALTGKEGRSSLFRDFHPLLAQIAEVRGFDREDILKEVLAHESLQPIVKIPLDVRKVFVQVKDIDPQWIDKTYQSFAHHFDPIAQNTFSKQKTTLFPPSTQPSSFTPPSLPASSHSGFGRG